MFDGRTLTPGRIAAIYLAFGVGALLLSDYVLPRVVADAALLRDLQAAKGLLEVALTAGLVYVLVARSRRSLAEANRELSAARGRLSVLYRLIRHNLRNELNVVRGFSEETSQRLDDAEAAAACEEVIDISDELIDRVEKINAFRDVVHGDARPEPQRLSPLVAAAVGEARARGGCSASVDVDVPGELAVRAVPQLREAVAELVGNAVAHGGDEPAVTVVAERRGSEVVLRVGDDGPGVPADERAVLGSERESAMNHGSGVGLRLAAWTVEESGGSIDIRDREPRGTEVVVSLPAATRAEAGRD